MGKPRPQPETHPMVVGARHPATIGDSERKDPRCAATRAVTGETRTALVALTTTGGRCWSLLFAPKSNGNRIVGACIGSTPAACTPRSPTSTRRLRQRVPTANARPPPPTAKWLGTRGLHQIQDASVSVLARLTCAVVHSRSDSSWVAPEWRLVGVESATRCSSHRVTSWHSDRSAAAKGVSPSYPIQLMSAPWSSRTVAVET